MISYTKENKDGVEEEVITIQIKDRRYPHSFTEVEMTLKDATLLLAELDKKLAEIPF